MAGVDVLALTLTDRDRSVVLSLAHTAAATLRQVAAAHFPGVGERRVRRRLEHLESLGLLARQPVGPRALPRQAGGRVLVLTDEGWRYAAALGAAPPPETFRRMALAVPAAVVAATEAYFVALPAVEDGRAEWILAPGARGQAGPQPPDRAWAVLRAAAGELWIDLDLPGRSLPQVQERVRAWASFIQGRQGVLVAYVAPDGARRQRLQSVLPAAPWLSLAPPARLVAQVAGGGAGVR